ncbi:hypothetical protein D3C86_719440 [compost metagenome]
MSFSSFKNSSPIYFYFISIVSFVLANMIREKSISIYYALLLVGLIFFLLGLVKRMKSK